MKRRLSLLCLTCLSALPAFAAALGTAPRNVIPAEVQQIISVDYRKLGGSPTAQALKARALPSNLQQFETALRAAGIDPDKDLEQLTFASFRAKDGLRILGIASGQFPAQKFRQRMRRQKVVAQKYRGTGIYPMGESVKMAFLDDYTFVFGDVKAIQSALDTRDGEGQSLNSNTEFTGLMTAVEDGSLWSVLDQAGTNNMLRSSLGEASKLTDFEAIRKRLRASRYSMDFDNGVDFDLDVITADNISAATLSSVIQAGVLYRKLKAGEAEKVFLENLDVNSDSDRVRMRFKTDEKKFQSLLQSDLFAAAVR
ncbi:MAG: hypothetical protein L0212_03950 [Acidobacteria bacterium]|nr:hypothetical protein [Acidobacteriota bacterium]